MSSTPRTCLVFGAYGGIGSELTRRLIQRGDRVVVSGRDAQRLQSLAKESGATALVADATDFEAVASVVSRVQEEFGCLDGVVNCVGSLLLKPAHLTKASEWRSTLETNLTSAFAVLRSSAGLMSRHGGGAIVLVSTAAASIGLPNHEAIAAAKGGIESLVRSAAATYGKSGVRVNAVAPGLVATPMTERITNSEKGLERSVAMHALGRIGAASDVAEAIAWLLSDEASWVTGQTLGVDGGLGGARSE